MAHLTAIIDQITRMENSLVNILLETAVKLSTLTDANIFVMVESAGGRKWAGRKSLRDEYVRGLLKPSTKDIEVTETVTSLPQEEFSMGSLMGMASGSSGGGGGGGGSHGIGGGGGSSSRQIDRSVSPEIPPVQTGPLYGSGPAVFPMAHQQPQQTPSSLGREMASDSAQQPSAAKRPRITMSASESTSAPSSGAASSSSASSSSNLPLNSLLPSAASKVLNISNNNVASSPPIHRKKSPIRDQHPQSVSMDGSLSSPKPTSSNNRQETISKNLKDEFNGDDEPSNDSVVIKEELGRMSTPRGMARDDGEDGFEEDPDASLIGGGGGGVGGGGGGGWGELALAGPSGLQQNPDANQPGTDGYRSVYRLTADDLYLADQFLYGTLRSDHGCAVPYPYMASSSVHLFWRGWLYRYDKARRVHTRYRCTKRQGQQCCSGAISICSTPGNPLEVIREVPHNLDPEPDMVRALEKVKAARMKAIYRQQATGKQYVVYLENGKFDEYDVPVKNEALAGTESGADGSIGSSVSPLSDYSPSLFLSEFRSLPS